MGLVRWWWFRPGCSVTALVLGFVALCFGLHTTGDEVLPIVQEIDRLQGKMPPELVATPNTK